MKSTAELCGRGDNRGPHRAEKPTAPPSSFRHPNGDVDRFLPLPCTFPLKAHVRTRYKSLGFYFHSTRRKQKRRKPKSIFQKKKKKKKQQQQRSCTDDRVKPTTSPPAVTNFFFFSLESFSQSSLLPRFDTVMAVPRLSHPFQLPIFVAASPPFDPRSVTVVYCFCSQ